MQRGKFIVFEGLDGSGKSTHMKLLAARLEGQGHRVLQTKEPTNGEVGRHLQKILSSGADTDMHLQAALFLADRIEHITDRSGGINRALDAGCTVICDRYYYSSFAYQGTKIDMDWVMDINLKSPAMLTPDLCVFLDVDPLECKSRLDAERHTLELYEKDAALMAQIRMNFMSVFEKLKPRENIVIIDANRPKPDVAQDIIAAVEVL